VPFAVPMLIILVPSLAVAIYLHVERQRKGMASADAVPWPGLILTTVTYAALAVVCVVYDRLGLAIFMLLLLAIAGVLTILHQWKRRP